ncbi:MAG TPA: GGDEF domain-containing protein [Rhodoblastus sp.]|nr:GGDEF domain-containing protein [Rhodoblastus sp.]
MPQSGITLQEVEELVATPCGASSFPPALEERYERETAPRRARFLAMTTLRTAFIYNLFLVCEYLLAPDTFILATALHLLIVTPWMLFVAHMLPSIVSPKWREGLAASIAIVMIAQVLAIYTITTSHYAARYIYFAPVIFLSVASIQRMPVVSGFRLAAIVFLMMATAAQLRGGEPPAIALVNAMSFACIAGVIINSNHHVWREQRRLYLLSVRDQLRAELSDSDANADALTGLGNRRYLDKRARALWTDAPVQVAAIIFDADHFKSFNDRYGHTRGDTCLKRIAGCATAELREMSDVAIRLGGEEFLLLLVDTDAEVAEIVAERIRATIAALGIPHAGNPAGVVTASFGVASASTRAATLEELIEMADGALYVAKSAGRNRTQRHDMLRQPAAA